jgi:hypothetical protein
MALLVRGGNYQIDLDAGIARCKVWRRPDVDRATGARFAEELADQFYTLASGAAQAMILDLHEAPPVNGPKTQAALGKILAVCEAAALPIALVSSEDPLQRMQLGRLARAHAPDWASVYDGRDEAERWVVQRSGRARP